MTGTLAPRHLALIIALLLVLGRGASQPVGAAPSQAPDAPKAAPAGPGVEADADLNPGQFFTVEEPIDSATLDRVKAGARQVIARATSQGGKAPILVFVFKPGQAAPGSSGFGTSLDLANFISTELGAAQFKVAYVPEPLKGYAVLPALACSQIVMGREASLGPITPDGVDAKPEYREPIRALARRNGNQPDLFLGLYDPQADLKVVRTADREVHYVLADDLAEFRRTHTAADGDITSAWEGGSRGKLTARRAREEGLVKLLADNPGEVANVYHIDRRAIGNDPTLLGEVRPVWVQIDGQLDPIKEGYLRRRIDQARRERVNLLFLQINSPGGLNTSADNIAGLLADIKDMKTVAYIDDQATGVSALLPLACDEIVFRRGARMGGAQEILVGRNHRREEMSEAQVESLARRAGDLASRKGHPTALAQAMVNRELRVYQATDAKSAASVLVLESEMQADPERYQNPTPIHNPGRAAMTIASNDAAPLHLGQEVGDVEEFKALYGVRGKAIRVDGPTWVDGLVTTLNDPFASWMVLFVGVFMLILEIKMPGVGLPGITSALAFLLFFWSRYLSGTADQLEILLFLVGLVCLGLELFVFPGFGVFGLSGFALILVSIVMASHTFVWPTQDYEYRQMAGTLGQIVGVMVGVGIGASLVGRYIPSLPVFNRMVLKPQGLGGSGLALDELGKPSPAEGIESFVFLLGETGRTTTTLRPAGKAQFGSLLVDVLADGSFIERGALIEVVEVQGSRVIVKPMA